MQSKLTLYVKLLIISAISVFVCAMIFVFIFESREKGIGWGFCSGLLVGNLLTSLSFKYTTAYVIVQTLIYGIVSFVLFYVVANYIAPNLPEQGSVLLLLMAIAMLLSVELANYGAKRIV